MNTVENIDEVEQISLLTTCTTRLHRSYRVTLHFLEIHQNISEISTPLLLDPPLYYFHKSRQSRQKNKISFCLMHYDVPLSFFPPKSLLLN